MSYSENDIGPLIEGCKKGDRLAQEKLYRGFYSVMMNICVRYTKNEADAFEVLNTGFFKVFKNIHSYSAGKAGPYTWVRTIIINTCLNHIRSKNKEMATHEISDSTEAYIQPEVVASLKAEDILQLVKQLPPATQAVFNLFVVDGYTHNEIAGMLNISEGTSKWHISEARKTLQKQLKAFR